MKTFLFLSLYLSWQTHTHTPMRTHTPTHSHTHTLNTYIHIQTQLRALERTNFLTVDSCVKVCFETIRNPTAGQYVAPAAAAAVETVESVGGGAPAAAADIATRDLHFLFSSSLLQLCQKFVNPPKQDLNCANCDQVLRPRGSSSALESRRDFDLWK